MFYSRKMFLPHVSIKDFLWVQRLKAFGAWIHGWYSSKENRLRMVRVRQMTRIPFIVVFFVIVVDWRLLCYIQIIAVEKFNIRKEFVFAIKFAIQVINHCFNELVRQQFDSCVRCELISFWLELVTDCPQLFQVFHMLAAAFVACQTIFSAKALLAKCTKHSLSLVWCNFRIKIVHLQLIATRNIIHFTLQFTVIHCKRHKHFDYYFPESWYCSDSKNSTSVEHSMSLCEITCFCWQQFHFIP